MHCNITVYKILDVSIWDNLSLISNGIIFKNVKEKMHKTVCDVTREI